MAVQGSAQYLTSLFDLQGKTALITGGTRGIGAGLTVALASAGADVILLQRDPSTGGTVKDRVRALGRACDSYACDLGDRQQVRNIVPAICERDSRNVDILVNCGGVQHRSPAVDFAEDKWDEVIQVNLTASFILARSLAKLWLSSPTPPGPDKKKIINIASVLTFSGSAEICAYVATKGAIGQLTKTLSNEWMGKGICVTALAPGYIATELTEGIRTSEEKEALILGRVPAGRWGLPEDLAGAVVYLASRASDFVSGEIHVVDGGFCGR
ncbi:MAG: hypothetical protein M1830_008303 [Pleopsidium flavum]|nr:MAG: hypothetical protein M1830_008303 [Pleopsidium flavum]